MRKRKADIRTYVIAVTGALAMIGLAVAAVLNPDEAVDKRHCPLDHESARTLVIAFDVSDPLISAEPRAVGFTVEQKLASLGKGDRIVALDVGGKSSVEVLPIVDQCNGGDGDNTLRNAFKNGVVRPIQAHLRVAQTAPASPESPLIETITNIAADPDLHRRASELHILLITDGLQNTAVASVYRHGRGFPKVSGEPLRGITVELFIVPNKRDLALQAHAVDRLKAWLAAAGATVDYRKPAWMALTNEKRLGGKV